MKHQRLLFQSFGSIERFDGMGESFALIPRNVCACVNNTLRLPASQNLGCDQNFRKREAFCLLLTVKGLRFTNRMEPKPFFILLMMEESYAGVKSPDTDCPLFDLFNQRTPFRTKPEILPPAVRRRVRLSSKSRNGVTPYSATRRTPFATDAALSASGMFSSSGRTQRT